MPNDDDATLADGLGIGKIRPHGSDDGGGPLIERQGTTGRRQSARVQRVTPSIWYSD
jgi:hypothetical protein